MVAQEAKLAIAIMALLVLLPASVYAAHGLSVSNSRAELNAGQRASFTLNTTNTAGDSITQIVADFSGFLFAGATCPAGFAQSNTASQLNCSGGLLYNLTSAFVGLDLTAPASAGTYYFTVTTRDELGGTSSATAGISVKTPASISVTPSFSSKKIIAGSTFTLSATLNNNGGSNVTNGTITIGLPYNYFLAPDESQSTKPLGAGSSVSWNIVAPHSPDTSDKTITLTPFGNDQNTGSPALTATQSTVTVRTTAMSVTAVVDETSAVYGGRVSISGYVKEGDTPLKTAYVSLVTSFSNRQTTYTDTSGYYSFAVFMPDRSGEQKLDITATYGDMSGSASASVFVGELLVNAAISPASISKGGSATIRGTVTKSGLRVSGAEVTTKIGTKTYSTSTDTYGVFSQSVTGAIAGTDRIEVTATSAEGKMGTAILSLTVTGTANKTIEITAPSTVAPSDNFTVSGSLYSDGEKIAGTVDLKFLGYTRSIDAPDGDFSLSLQAPANEGCNDLVASRDGFTGAKIKVCAYLHKDFTISISARKYTPGQNIITIVALYEDGTPVSGSLTYGIESTQYTGINITGAKLIDYNFTKTGKYFVSAYVNDGIRNKMFSKTIEINSTSPTTPKVTPTITATPTVNATGTASSTGNTTAAPSTTVGTESAKTNLALLLIGGIIILLLFF